MRIIRIAAAVLAAVVVYLLSAYAVSRIPGKLLDGTAAVLEDRSE